MRDSDQHQTSMIIDFITRYYKPLIIFPGIAAVTALIISLFLPKKYEAHAEIFPAYFSSVDQNLENPTIGYDVEADRILKILHSESLRDAIVKKFDLVKYWDVDTTQKNYKYYLNNKFDKHIKFKRTPAMSIVVSALTYDADFSVQIVNEIINQVDFIRERMFKSNLYTAYDVNKNELKQTKFEMDSIVSIIKDIRVKNHLYYPSLHQNVIVNAAVESNGEVRTILEQLVDEYNIKMEHYKTIFTKLKKAEQMISAPINKVYVLDKATTDYKKKFPRTTINILGAFGASAVLVIVVLLFRIEYFKRTKKSIA